MINKRNLYTLLTGATISGVLVICSIAQDVRQEKIIANTPPVIEVFEPIPYVIKEYNGYLAVFRGESQSPFRILDCEFAMLSDFDKELFYTGLVVETESELNKLIEDYTS